MLGGRAWTWTCQGACPRCSCYARRSLSGGCRVSSSPAEGAGARGGGRGERGQALVAAGKAARGKQAKQAERMRGVGVRESPESPRGARVEPPVGTRSVVIRWVDACISPLDLLAELAPD